MSDSATASSARLDDVDLLRVRHLLGGVMTLVALWGLALVDSASPAVSLAALAAVCAGLPASGWLASRGARFWTWTGVLVGVGALGDLAFTVAADRSQIVPAVIRATVYIAVLRTLQPRTRREEMQLILLSLFLCAAGGALSLSPLFAVQVALFIPLSGGVLFLINRLEGVAKARMDGEDWKNFRARDFLRRLRESLTPGTLAFLAGALAGVGLLAAFIFVNLPRARMDRAVPFLQLSGKGRTGFSDTVTLGGIGEMQQDASVALRADAPGRRRPTSPPYWRMAVLDAYTGSEGSSGFALSSGAESFFRNASGRGNEWTAPPSPRGSDGATLSGDWSVFLEGNVSRYLPTPGTARRIRFDKPQEWSAGGPLRTVRLRETPSAGVPMLVSVAGDAVRYPPEASERALLASAETAGESRYPGTLLALPRDAASRLGLTRALESAGARDEADSERFTEKVEAWLHRRHAYALTDGYGRKSAAAGEPADYLVRWMNSEATGWCEHFASSFVLLARASGRPARLVTGFSGGEWNDAENYLVVRMKHAHAWAELYDRRGGVWMRVDPTPAGPSSSGGPEAEARAGLRAFAGLGAWYDSLTMLWFRRVVNFDEREQRETFREAASNLKSWGIALAEWLKARRAEAIEALRRWKDAPAALAAPAAALSAGAAALWVLLRIARRLASRRVRRAGESDPRVRRYRERAGRALVALDTCAAAGRPIAPSVRAAVEVVRFGRPSEWPDPETALADAARARRRSRRR